MVHPTQVGEAEPLNRFLLNRHEFGTNPPRVTHHAFMPNLNRKVGRLEKSIHRIRGLSSARVWQLGRLFVEQRVNSRTIKARAVGGPRVVVAAGLGFRVGGSPWPRHTDIVGWPSEKDRQKLLAMEVAAEFSFEEAEGS